MAVTLRYFTEFGKHTFQHITAASICGGIYARVCCVLNASPTLIPFHTVSQSVSQFHCFYSSSDLTIIEIEIAIF